MPAVLESQQKAAGAAALSAKRGETHKTKLAGASRKMVDSMTEKGLDEIDFTKRSKLPDRKQETKYVVTTVAKSQLVLERLSAIAVGLVQSACQPEKMV